MVTRTVTPQAAPSAAVLNLAHKYGRGLSPYDGRWEEVIPVTIRERIEQDPILFLTLACKAIERKSRVYDFLDRLPISSYDRETLIELLKCRGGVL